MKLKQRFKTSIFIVLATVLAIISKLLPYTIGDYIFDIFVLAIAYVASMEIGNIMEKNNKKLNKFMASLYAVVNYVVLILSFRHVEFYTIILIQFVALFCYWLLILLIEWLNNRKTPFKQHVVTSLNTILTCIYPTFFLMLLLNFNHADEFHAGVKYFSLVFVVMVFAITWLTDTFAYLVGCTLKGPKLAPKISPNKTISGSIGGILGGIAGAMLVYLLVYNVSALSTILSMYNLAWWHFLLIGLFGSVCGQIGDLFESKLKRNAGVKDSGDIFPGHGGMLDRFDAMIFVATFVYLVILLIL
ncbi:MAG: phosphatidate cytidylyltransferase [Clostridia bacterium]|nr:phosphatidate cytidylyltransferase [Clostridia bacterium]